MRQPFVTIDSTTTHEMQPFTREIMEGLVAMSDQQLWNSKWGAMREPPDDEDELVQFIMGMSVPEVLRLFAPMIRRR